MVPDPLSRCSRRDALRAVAGALPVALAGCSTTCPDSTPPTPESVVRTDAEPTGTVPSSAVAPDWPTYRHDARNTGFGADAAPPDGSPSLAWRTRLSGVGAGPSAPVLHDGRVYVVADGTLHALDARDGTERWRVDAVPAHDAPTVAPSGGAVLVAGKEGAVAIDLPGSGGPRIRWRLADDATGSALADGERAYVPVEGALLALDLATGEERWRESFDGPVTRPALVDDAVLAVGSRLVALDASDGTVRWEKDDVSTYPVVDADAGLAYSGDYDGLHAIDLGTGRERWRFEREATGFAAPVVTPGTLYAIERVPEGPNAIFALDPATGDPEPRWCSWLGEGDVSAAGSGHVLVTHPVRADDSRSDGYALQSFRRDTGEATWRLRADRPIRAPALGDGLTVAVVDDGVVCALVDGGDGS